MLWTTNFFFLIIYSYLVFSFIIYCLPNFKHWFKNKNKKNFNKFFYIPGQHLLPCTFLLCFLLVLVHLSWLSPTVYPWFGHLIFDSFQYKIFFLMLFIFLLIQVITQNTSYYSNSEAFDFYLLSHHIFLWFITLFYVNSIFTFLFTIEILSTIIFLFLVSSSSNTTYIYNNVSLRSNSYFQKTFPVTYSKSLIFFFWISLFASINLFLFSILIYINFLTFDWTLMEHLLFFINTFSNFKSLCLTIVVWFNLLFCIFLKCGIAPFFIWKPVFFKGLPIYSLYFYICFFYFFFFIFLLNFLTVNCGELFLNFIYVNILLLVLGLILVFFLLCDSFYIKSFLAVSSILNSLFVLLSLTHVNSSFLFFIL
jgi:hypothetical protein